MAIQKQRKKVNGSTIAIAVLAILLVASIIIGITLAYFTASATVAGQITLGNPVTISITQGGASAASLTFPGDALPGTVYSQAIGVVAPADMTEALMRAKLTITNTNGASTNVDATATSSWVKGDDGYHYYNGSITANESIDFITSLTVPTSLTNDDAKKSFNVDIVVETIQKANNAANAVWTTAPADWLATYSPVVQTSNLYIGDSYFNNNGYNQSNDNNQLNENYSKNNLNNFQTNIA